MQYLGQHFLKNTSAGMQIINALRLEEGETVIEIGPGTGALTWPLLKQCARLNCRYIGIEKDKELADQLAAEMPGRGFGKIATIISGDALLELPAIIHNSLFIIPNRYAIVGNIPYYITGALLRVMSELENKPAVAVLMVQKEVAERICAQPPQMNLLAAATQVWAQPKLLLTLKPSDFEPAPAVHSAVIQLTTHSKQLTTGESKHYYAALHRIFKQPRKMLINNLLDPLTRPEAEKIMAELDIPLTCRPQDLSIGKLLKLGGRL